MTTVEIRARISTSTTHLTILVQYQKESSQVSRREHGDIHAINGKTQTSFAGHFNLLKALRVTHWDLAHAAVVGIFQTEVIKIIVVHLAQSLPRSEMGLKI